MKKPLYSNGYSQTLYDIIDVLKTGLDDCSIDDAEDSLLVRLRDYLLATDKGLALLGQQYGMTVDNDEISIDLLFYPVFLVEEPPCRTPLHLACHRTILKVTDHRSDKFIVPWIRIVKNGFSQLVFDI